MPVAAQKSRILVGDFPMSSYATKISTPNTVVALDTTVLASAGGARTYIPGQSTSMLSVDGYYDKAEHADEASWLAAGQPVTVGLSGLTLGSEVWMANVLETNLTASAAVAGVSAFSLSGQTDGATDFGVSLADLAAVTVDTSGTGVDNTASTAGGGVAHLHVTAFSGFSGAVVIVEDSANNSTWATIGTFTTVAGATTERITVAGTVRQYVRCSIDVTGSGSVTYSVAFARR